MQPYGQLNKGSHFVLLFTVGTAASQKEKWEPFVPPMGESHMNRKHWSKQEVIVKIIYSTYSGMFEFGQEDSGESQEWSNDMEVTESIKNIYFIPNMCFALNWLKSWHLFPYVPEDRLNSLNKL